MYSNIPKVKELPLLAPKVDDEVSIYQYKSFRILNPLITVLSQCRAVENQNAPSFSIIFVQ